MSEEELAAARPRPRARTGRRRNGSDPTSVAASPTDAGAAAVARPPGGVRRSAEPRPPGLDPLTQLEHRLHTLERRLLVAVDAIEGSSALLDQRLTALEQGLLEQLDAHARTLADAVARLSQPVAAGARREDGAGTPVAVRHGELELVTTTATPAAPEAVPGADVAALLDEVASRLDAFAGRVAAIEDPRAALDHLAGRIDALSARLAEVAGDGRLDVALDRLADLAADDGIGRVLGQLERVAEGVAGTREDVAGARQDVAGTREDVAGTREEVAAAREVLEGFDAVLAEVATVQGIEVLLARLEGLAGERGVGGLHTRLDQLARGGAGARRLRRGAEVNRLEGALDRFEQLLEAGSTGPARPADAGADVHEHAAPADEGPIDAPPGEVASAVTPGPDDALPESAFWSDERRAEARAELRSWVLEVDRVGPKRADALADAFGDLDELAAASVDDVVALTGLPPDVAAAVLVYVTS